MAAQPHGHGHPVGSADPGRCGFGASVPNPDPAGVAGVLAHAACCVRRPAVLSALEDCAGRVVRDCRDQRGCCFGCERCGGWHSARAGSILAVHRDARPVRRSGRYPGARAVAGPWRPRPSAHQARGVTDRSSARHHQACAGSRGSACGHVHFHPHRGSDHLRRHPPGHRLSAFGDRDGRAHPACDRLSRVDSRAPARLALRSPQASLPLRPRSFGAAC